ncbi:MAG TPA: carboxypeptidase regulatory-like domain-containing protein [Myxococcaceae bacterium]
MNIRALRPRASPAAALLAAALLAPACSRPEPAPPEPAHIPAASPKPDPAPGAPGTIEGTIHLTGQAPPPLPVSVPPDLTRVCGEKLESPRAVVGPGGGLSEVVAWVSGVPGPLSAAPAPPAIDQRGCAFRPRVVAAAQGTEVQVINSDPLLHNVRTAAGSTRPFNTAMPITGMKVPMPLSTSPGVTRLTCDVHPWMTAFIQTFDHPYFGVSDASGRFTIRGVPAGKASLRFWHPFLGERGAEVEVPAGGVAQPRIDWPAP